ncbi:hypothetical protein PAMA_020103 [Pampus argenteus]
MLKDVEQMLLDLNQLEQKCEKLQKEIDKLKKREAETILAIEQKSSLDEKLLQMKTEAVAELHEKMQVKLWMALVFTRGDQTAARNLKDLCESRHATLKALKQHEALEEYDELEKTLKTLDTSVPRRDVLQRIRASAATKGSQVISYCKLRTDGPQRLPACSTDEDHNQIRGKKATKKDSVSPANTDY